MENIETKKIAERMKIIRLAYGIKQTDISKATGVPQAQISKLETGENVYAETLLRISKFLSRYVNTDIFFDETRFEGWQKFGHGEKDYNYYDVIDKHIRHLHETISDASYKMKMSIESQFGELNEFLSKLRENPENKEDKDKDTISR